MENNKDDRSQNTIVGKGRILGEYVYGENPTQARGKVVLGQIRGVDPELRRVILLLDCPTVPEFWAEIPIDFDLITFLHDTLIRDGSDNDDAEAAAAKEEEKE